MANTAVFGIYASRAQVEAAVEQLGNAGFRATDISLLLPENLGTKDLVHEKHTKAPEGAVAGGTDPRFVLGGGRVVIGKNGTDVFKPVRDRLRGGKGRLRQSGADYLMYALVDAIVDQYFLVLESLGEKIELLEQVRTEQDTLEDIFVGLVGTAREDCG